MKYVFNICQLASSDRNNHSKLGRMEFLKPHMISQEVGPSSITSATNAFPFCVSREQGGQKWNPPTSISYEICFSARSSCEQRATRLTITRATASSHGFCVTLS